MANKNDGKKNSSKAEKSKADDGAQAPEAAADAAADKRRLALLEQFSKDASFGDDRSVIGEVRTGDAPVVSASAGSRLSPLQVQGVELRKLNRHGGKNFVNDKGDFTWPAFPNESGHESVITLEEELGEDGELLGWKDGYGRVFQTPGTFLQVSRELYEDADLGVGLKIEGLHQKWLPKWIQKPNAEGKMVGGRKTVVLVGCTAPGCIVGSEHQQTLKRGRTMLRDEHNNPVMEEVEVVLSSYEEPIKAQVPVYGYLRTEEPLRFGEAICNDFGDLIRAKKTAFEAVDGVMIRDINDVMDSMDKGAPMAFLRATSDLHNPAHPLNENATNSGNDDFARLRFVKLGEYDGREIVKPIEQSEGAWALAERDGVVTIKGQEFPLEYAGLDPATSKGIARRPNICPSCKSWVEGEISTKKGSAKRTKAATDMKGWRARFSNRRPDKS